MSYKQESMGAFKEALLDIEVPLYFVVSVEEPFLMFDSMIETADPARYPRLRVAVNECEVQYHIDNSHMPFNHEQARQEGWGMFNVDGRWQLQRLYDPEGRIDPVFASDAEALIWVARRTHREHNAMRAIEMIGTPVK